MPLARWHHLHDTGQTQLDQISANKWRSCILLFKFFCCSSQKHLGSEDQHQEAADLSLEQILLSFHVGSDTAVCQTRMTFMVTIIWSFLEAEVLIVSSCNLKHETVRYHVLSFGSFSDSATHLHLFHTVIESLYIQVIEVD